MTEASATPGYKVDRKSDTLLWQTIRAQGRQRKWICEQTKIEYWRLDRLLHGLPPTEEEVKALVRVLGVPQSEIFTKQVVTEPVYSHR